ncbi:AI-2E family transporter [Roseococcus sp. DSY-14]|uniref:AI-2E family transporter n=1 Tax=Roseococcus sp. DSY-14 TaxID=3369650 RepID=UPI00387AF536
MDLPDDDRRFLRRLLMTAGLGVFLLLLWAAREAILVSFAAVLIAILLDGAAGQLCARLGLGRKWALLAAGLLIIGAVVGAVALVGSQMAAQVAQLSQALPGALQGLEQRLGLRVPEEARSVSEGMLAQLAGLGRIVMDALAAVALAVVGGAYLALEPERYRRGFVKLFPKALTQEVEEVLATLGRALRRWLLATLLAMACVGVAAGLAAWALGLPAPLAIGLFAGLMEVVPTLGAFIGAVPALLVAASQGGEALLWTAGAFLLIQQLESNLLSPLVGERLVDVPAFVLVVGVVAAGTVFGLPGVVLAAPITVVALAVVQRLWVREALERRVEVTGERE